MSPNENAQRDPIFEQSPWVKQAKDHWKQFRPKMYAELEKSGLLHERAVKAAEQTEHDLMSMVRQGYPYDGAWEAVRERYLFLPSEKDEPNLGQNPGSSPPETGRKTTTASQTQTPSEAAENEQSTVPMSPPSGSSNS